MDLQLNEQVYSEFYGSALEQMPKLIAQGRVQLSVSGLIQKKLEISDKAKFSESVRNAWHCNYFDTCDGIAYHPDGKIKIVLDARPLKEMNTQSKLIEGALILPDGLYQKLEGQEFTEEKLNKYAKNALTRQEAKSNILWQALARDNNLLNDYVDFVFHETNRRFGYKSNMKICVASSQKEPTMRLWSIKGLEYGSFAYGSDGLRCDDGRLVGVLDGVQSPLVEAAQVRDASSAGMLEQKVNK